MMSAKFYRYRGLEPSKIQATVDGVAKTLLPAVQDAAGCLNGFVLVDRSAGTVTGVTLWESAGRMRASEEREVRVRASLEENATIDWWQEPQIERHEIVLDQNQILELGTAAAAPAGTTERVPAGG